MTIFGLSSVKSVHNGPFQSFIFSPVVPYLFVIFQQGILKCFTKDIKIKQKHETMQKKDIHKEDLKGLKLFQNRRLIQAKIKLNGKLMHLLNTGE